MKNIFLLTPMLLLASGNLNVQEKKEGMTVNGVVNTLKERITLVGYAQLGYIHDDVVKKTSTFDIKRIIFVTRGRITDRWTCGFMYDFYNGGMLLEIYVGYWILPGLEARIGEFKVPYTIGSELSPITVELINCYSQSVCYLAGVGGSDIAYDMASERDISMMIHGGLLDDLLYYKLAAMNEQGLNIKDKNSQKDIISNLMVNSLKQLSVGGSSIKGTGHAVTDSEIISIPAGGNYIRNHWSIGGIITTSSLSLCPEYLAEKDGTVKNDGFYATGSCQLLRNFDFIASYGCFNADKAISRKQTNYIAGLQCWFYPRCKLQAQYIFRDRSKGKDSNLFQAQVQVRF